MRFFQITVMMCTFVLAGCGGGGGGSAPAIGSSTSPASIGINTSRLNFSAPENGSTPEFQDINVIWSASNIAGVDFEVSGGGNMPDWLGVTKIGTSSPLTLEFVPTRTDMTPETYSIKIDIVARNSAQTVLDTKSVDVIYVIESEDPQGGGPGNSGGDPAAKRATEDQIFHFGEPIILNGANVAWSAGAGNWYNHDIGATDGAGNPRTNVAAFQNHFSRISNAGGNSARIWLHTASTVTPAIDANGIVTGLSHDLSNTQVIDQLDAILDAAWDEGILVTFNLFSFNMLCDQNQPNRSKVMIENNLQTYIDNALTPMVIGVKDHPAMFAWDIFNEPEGVTRTDYFCPSSQIFTYETLQVTVNQLAAAIHASDPNVKVTTSTHTDLYDQFSNSTLTTQPNGIESGTLDFYSLHWYDTGWLVSPHVTFASEFNADRPIVAGEYDVEGTGSGGPSGEDSIENLFNLGYAGAWPWSLTTGNVGLIEAAISQGASLSPVIDKLAIEACIQSRDTSCYNQ